VDRKEIQAKIWETYEAGSLLVACSWCARLCFEGEWVRPARDALMSIDAALTMSHSICPDCAEVQLALPQLPMPETLSEPA
jgi:hypothetical protein